MPPFISNLAVFYGLGFGFYFLGIAQNQKGTWHGQEVSMGLVVPSLTGPFRASAYFSREHPGKPPIGGGCGHVRAHPALPIRGQVATSRPFPHGIDPVNTFNQVSGAPQHYLARPVGKVQEEQPHTPVLCGFRVEELESASVGSPALPASPGLPLPHL